MIYINNYKYTNLELLDGRAKFVTDYEAGLSNGIKLYDTYAEAKMNKAYGPIYIAFPIEYKKDK